MRITQQRLTAAQAAAVLHLTGPRVTKLLQANIDEFTLDELVKLLPAHRPSCVGVLDRQPDHIGEIPQVTMPWSGCRAPIALSVLEHRRLPEPVRPVSPSLPTPSCARHDRPEADAEFDDDAEPGSIALSPPRGVGRESSDTHPPTRGSQSPGVRPEVVEYR